MLTSKSKIAEQVQRKLRKYSIDKDIDFASLAFEHWAYILNDGKKIDCYQELDRAGVRLPIPESIYNLQIVNFWRK